MHLRPDAPVFMPSQALAIPTLPADPWSLNDVSELSVSPAELEELEEVESWVQLMSDLEMEEHNHMIEMALRYGDKKRIQDIKQKVVAARDKAGGKKKHGHHHHGARPAAGKKQ
eukprot:scaffold7.g3559.t1